MHSTRISASIRDILPTQSPRAHSSQVPPPTPPLWATMTALVRSTPMASLQIQGWSPRPHLIPPPSSIWYNWPRSSSWDAFLPWPLSHCFLVVLFLLHWLLLLTPLWRFLFIYQTSKTLEYAWVQTSGFLCICPHALNDLIQFHGFKHHPNADSRILIFSPDLHWSFLSNYQLDISTWVANWHLQLKIPQMELLIYPPRPTTTITSNSPWAPKPALARDFPYLN